MLTSARLCMRLPVSVASCPKQALPARPFSSGTQTGSSHSSWMGSGNTPLGTLQGSSSRQDRVRDDADEQLRTKLLPMGGILAKDLDKLAGHIQEAAVPGALEPVWQTLRQLRQQRGRCLPCETWPLVSY